MAEKAYAQINESGWLEQDSTNTYSGLAGGWPDTSLQHITAQSTIRDYDLTNSDHTNVVSQFNAGRTVFLNWASHALTLVGYNSVSEMFTIYNPWGYSRDLTWSQILSGYGDWPSFDDWSYSTS